MLFEPNPGRRNKHAPIKTNMRKAYMAEWNGYLLEEKYGFLIYVGKMVCGM